MENLNLEDQQGQPGAAGQSLLPLLGGGPPPPNQQLPPQMFTTAAQLLDLTDSKRCAFGIATERCVEVVEGKSLAHGKLIRSSITEKLMVSLRDGRKLIGVLRSWDQFGKSYPCNGENVLLLTYLYSKLGSSIHDRTHLRPPLIQHLRPARSTPPNRRSCASWPLRRYPARHLLGARRERAVTRRD